MSYSEEYDEEKRAFYANDWGTTIPLEICKQRIAEIDAAKSSSSYSSYSRTSDHYECNFEDNNCLSYTPMTLQQAIEHAKAKAQELGDCKCAKEHLQLAKWLTELYAYKYGKDKYKVGDFVSYWGFKYKVTASLGNNNYIITDTSDCRKRRCVNEKELYPYTG